MDKFWVTNWNDGRKTEFLVSRREEREKSEHTFCRKSKPSEPSEGWETYLGAGLGPDAVGVLRRPETTTGALLDEPPPPNHHGGGGVRGGRERIGRLQAQKKRGSEMQERKKWRFNRVQQSGIAIWAAGVVGIPRGLTLWGGGAVSVVGNLTQSNGGPSLPLLLPARNMRIPCGISMPPNGRPPP